MVFPKHLLHILLLLCNVHLMSAQETVTTGLMIEDSAPLGAGVLEISSTYSDRILAGTYGIILLPAEGVSERSRTIAVGAAYGVADGLDFMTELQWESEFCRGGQPERSSGLGDFRLGMKVRLWEPSTGTSLSWVPVFTVPVTASLPAAISAGTDQLLVLSGHAGRLAMTIQTGVHYGYAVAPDPNLHLHFATGIGYQAVATLQPRLEIHVENAPFDGDAHMTAAMMAGLIWQCHDLLRVDLGLHALAIGENAWDERTFLLRLVFCP